MSVTIRTAAGVTDATLCVWGTSGAGTTTLGKIVSCGKKNTAKITEEPDENGELYAWITSDNRNEVDVEIMCKSTAVEPAIGDLITIAGVTDCIVKESSVKWTAGATKKIAISAFKKV